MYDRLIRRNHALKETTPPADLYERLLRRLVSTWNADTDQDFLDTLRDARTALNGSADEPIYLLRASDVTAVDTLAVHRQLLLYAGASPDRVDRALTSFRQTEGNHGNGRSD